MLDMGFEREMNECLSLIKRRCKAKFTNEAGLYHSDQISINFISATLSSKVQALGAKLMSSFKSVGFSSESSLNSPGKNDKLDDLDAEEREKNEVENILESMPKQVKQYWMQVPCQYRLLYLLAFLYAHQDKKVIVFASTCETVNLLMLICKSLDWDYCINRRGNVEKRTFNDAGKQQ